MKFNKNNEKFILLFFFFFNDRLLLNRDNCLAYHQHLCNEFHTNDNSCMSFEHSLLAFQFYLISANEKTQYN